MNKDSGTELPSDLVQVKLKGRPLTPHKAVMSPVMGVRNVLTNSPWTYVGLWLKRSKKDRALFYWQQAEEFHRVSLGLAPSTAPLLLYYSFLNATKALLTAKGVTFNEYHGVAEKSSGGTVSLSNRGIKIKQNGVLPSLSGYYGETEGSKEHTLQELFFNMVFIHRTYCLTYTSQTEMFIPLADCGYVAQKSTRRIFFRGNVTSNITFSAAAKRLPSTFVADPAFGPRAVRSVASVQCRKPGRPSKSEIAHVALLNRDLRRELFFINGTQPLWYIRGTTSGPARLDRQLPTLILGAMHRLSEICRYQPLQLASLLAGQKNWLLSEFIQMAVQDPKYGATGATFIAADLLSASVLDQNVGPLLLTSLFHKAFIFLQLERVIYGWSRGSTWKVLKDKPEQNKGDIEKKRQLLFGPRRP